MARKITDDEVGAYLRDHLPYEVLMTRYTSNKLPTISDQLEWNICCECFFLHARLLYKFLTNDSGNGNVKACDFGGGFKAEKSDGTIKLLKKMDKQIFHLLIGAPFDPLIGFQH